MKKSVKRGFVYRVSDEMLTDYKNKPVELRLAWLYAGNVLRKACPENIKLLHDKFRGNKESGWGTVSRPPGGTSGR